MFNPVVACNGSGPRQSSHALHQSGSLSHASQKKRKKMLELPVSEQIWVDMKRLKAADANLKARHSHLYRETSAPTDVWRSASSRCHRDFIAHLHIWLGFLKKLIWDISFWSHLRDWMKCWIFGSLFNVLVFPCSFYCAQAVAKRHNVYPAGVVSFQIMTNKVVLFGSPCTQMEQWFLFFVTQAKSSLSKQQMACKSKVSGLGKPWHFIFPKFSLPFTF